MPSWAWVFVVLGLIGLVAVAVESIIWFVQKRTRRRNVESFSRLHNTFAHNNRIALYDSVPEITATTAKDDENTGEREAQSMDAKTEESEIDQKAGLEKVIGKVVPDTPEEISTQTCDSETSAGIFQEGDYLSAGQEHRLSANGSGSNSLSGSQGGVESINGITRAESANSVKQMEKQSRDGQIQEPFVDKNDTSYDPVDKTVGARDTCVSPEIINGTKTESVVVETQKTLTEEDCGPETNDRGLVETNSDQAASRADSAPTVINIG